MTIDRPGLRMDSRQTACLHERGGQSRAAGAERAGHTADLSDLRQRAPRCRRPEGIHLPPDDQWSRSGDTMNRHERRAQAKASIRDVRDLPNFDQERMDDFTLRDEEYKLAN